MSQRHTASHAPAFSPRDATGVPGLDDILGGGLPRGALVIVTGPPGSGKTVLAGQMAFAAAQVGRRAILTTALSEPPLETRGAPERLSLLR